MSIKQPNIGTLTFSINKAGCVPTSKLVDILCRLSNDFYLVTGSDGYIFFNDDKRIRTYEIKHKRGTNVFTRIFRYIYTQLKVSYVLAKLTRNVDIWIFFIGGGTLLLPMLISKLLRKKVVLVSAGSASQTMKFANDNLSKPIELLEIICHLLSDQIVVESEDIIGFLRLNKYIKKIAVIGTMFVDADNFKIMEDFNDREYIIGYIGRISPEKGVLNFAKAIPLILKKRDKVHFSIGGNGPLFKELEHELKNSGSYDKVELLGWISHDELPKYLNKLKLIVAPSYTEGGVPTIIMEAMACGTIVLVTPVAGVDVIKDGESGFILENNSPECIAENVIRALEHPNLGEIISNAHKLIKEDFSCESEVIQYGEVIYKLLHKQMKAPESKEA